MNPKFINEDLLEALKNIVWWNGHRDKDDNLLPPDYQTDEIAQAMRAIDRAEQYENKTA